MSDYVEKRSVEDRRRGDRRSAARRADERKKSRRDYKLSYRRHRFVLQSVRKLGPISIGRIREMWNQANGESVSYKTIARDMEDLIVYDHEPLEYAPSLRGWIYKKD